MNLGKIAGSAFKGLRSFQSGGAKIAIDGGTELACTIGPERHSREREVEGWDEDIERSVSIAEDEFAEAYPNPLRSYHGKLATLQGKTYRVASHESAESGYFNLLLTGQHQGA